jgi:histone deacetylase 1/2
MTDHNTREYLEKIKQQVFDILRDKEAAPSVGMHGTSIHPAASSLYAARPLLSEYRAMRLYARRVLMHSDAEIGA